MLLDFDELMLKVRSPAARAYIGDAVASFRAGALRPAVVSAWTAAVFDIMAKIREIELTGDKRAKQHADRFDTIRETNDVTASLEIEREILDIARDVYELLTPQQHLDLTRLREDRHRCAHAAMNTADEAYQPSAELVRYHIGSVLSHLLVHPPVQGKAALTRLKAEVSSPLFPKELSDAVRVLTGGPLQRPKDALVRDFVLATAKATLRGDLAADDAFARRALTALKAVGQMHPTLVARTYTADLPRVLGGLSDHDVWRVLRLGVAISVVWEHVPEAVLAKLERLVDTVDVAQWPNVLMDAIRTPRLASRAEFRASGLSRDELIAVFRHDLETASTTRVLVVRAVEELVASPSWNATNSLISAVLLPAAASLTEADFEAIAGAADDNVEVSHAHGTLGLLTAIRDAGTVSRQRYLSIFFAHDLGPRFPDVLEGLDDEIQTVNYPDRVVALVEGIRVRHPKFGDGEVVQVVGIGGDERVRVDFDDEAVGRKTLVRALSQLEIVQRDVSKGAEQGRRGDRFGSLPS